MGVVWVYVGSYGQIVTEEWWIFGSIYAMYYVSYDVQFSLISLPDVRCLLPRLLLTWESKGRNLMSHMIG